MESEIFFLIMEEKFRQLLISVQSNRFSRKELALEYRNVFEEVLKKDGVPLVLKKIIKFFIYFFDKVAPLTDSDDIRQSVLSIVDDILDDGKLSSNCALLVSPCFRDLKDDLLILKKKYLKKNTGPKKVLILLRVVLFLSLLKDCEIMPTLDIDVFGGLIIQFPSGLLSLVFSLESVKVFHQPVPQLAKNGDFEQFAIESGDMDNVEKLVYILWSVCRFPKYDKARMEDKSFDIKISESYLKSCVVSLMAPVSA